MPWIHGIVDSISIVGQDQLFSWLLYCMNPTTDPSPCDPVTCNNNNNSSSTDKLTIEMLKCRSSRYVGAVQYVRTSVSTRTWW